MARPNEDLHAYLAQLSSRATTRRRFLTVSLALASTGLLAACGEDGDDADTDDSADDDEADSPADEEDDAADSDAEEEDEEAEEPDDSESDEGDEPDEARVGGTLTIAVPQEPESMDPYVASAPSSGAIYDNFYDQLVVLDPEGELTPGLAETWEFSEDEPTRWTFEIREGVTWHNGDPCRAEEIKYHLDRVFDEDEPGRPAGLAPQFDSSEVVDEYVLEIITSEPYAMQANDMAPRWQSIASNETQLEEVGEDAYGENPVGTGPFQFINWQLGEQITLEAYDDYWGGRPYLDEVIFRFIPEDSSRLLSLETEEVDFIYGVPVHEIQRLEDDENYTVLRAVSFVTQYMTFNTTAPMFEDVQVRQAIAHSIDKQELVELGFEGEAAAAEQVISPGVAGHTESIETAWPYDPDRAAELFSEAGWELNDDGILEQDGETLSVEFSFSVTARHPANVPEILQEQLRRVGVDVQLQEVDHAAILDEYPQGEMQFYAYGQGLGTAHFGQLSFPHFHSTGGRNYHFLHESNPDAAEDLDAAVEAAANELDDEERQAQWERVMEINREQALMIPIYHPVELGAVLAKVQGAYLHPGEYLRVHEVWIDE